MPKTRRGSECLEDWPTLAMAAACYGVWTAAILVLPGLSVWVAIAVVGAAIALHSLLQHEALHGHPFGTPRANAALVWPALGLFVPFGRFRDTHLAHHRDVDLTDPYDDPESNYLDPARWTALPGVVRAMLQVNNTLAGRMALGPLIGQAQFLARDAGAWRGDPRIARAWAAHLPAAGSVLALVAWSTMPLWAYLVAAWLGMGLLKIRTFAEHHAHTRVPARSVVIEDRGPLALLFLNNNLHAVHHMNPAAPWFRLPEIYRAQGVRIRSMNGGYVIASYRALFRRHLLRPKDPVPHPLMGEGAAARRPQPELAETGRVV